MASLDAFEDALRHGGYQTPPAPAGAVPMRRGFRAWWRFYVGGVLRALFSGLASRLRKECTARVFSELSFEIIKAVESTGATITVEGTGNIASLGDAPRVYVANHSSLLETFHLPCILNPFGPITVVAKRSLARYPIFGSCLRAVHPILLDRKNARKDLADTIEQGKAHLASGRSVLLFPQGTRSASFDPRKFNSLGAKLALAAGVPLVPVACKTDFAQPGRFIKDVGPIDPSRPVRYAIGKPLQPTLAQRELQEASASFISGALASWQ